jgi:y4mF family transcriptional regulator
MWIRTVDDVAELVRDRRKQLGLTQVELARMAGVSRQWLVDLERGKPTAEVALVLRTLAAAGVQLDARDPMHHPEGSYAATIIDAGREVMDRYRPAGAPMRTLSTRPPRPPSPGSIRGPKREP